MVSLFQMGWKEEQKDLPQGTNRQQEQVLQVVPTPHAQLAQGFAVRTFRI